MKGVVRLSTVSGTTLNRHVLAHLNTGVTYAWANNSKGQLGNRSQKSVTVPTVVGSSTISVPPNHYMDISQGGFNSLPIDVTSLSTGYLMVYGKNVGSNELYVWKSLDDSIVRVVADKNNSSHATLYAVREGETRVLVENTITGQIAFTRVVVTDGVTYPQLVLGRDTSTALKKGGTVWAWGDNTYREVDYTGSRDRDDELNYNPHFGDYTGKTYGAGKLGIGSPQSLITIPVQLDYYLEEPGAAGGPAFENIMKIASGDDHNLAVDRNGYVYTWGDNTYGQLGFSPLQVERTSRPVRLNILDDNGNRPNFISVAAGSNHSLALTSDGQVYAWGANQYGQLGRGEGHYSDYDYSTAPAEIRRIATVNGDYEPTAMLGFNSLVLTGVLDLAATEGATGVLLVDGSIWTVGSNKYGQLGTGAIYEGNPDLPGYGLKQSGILAGGLSARAEYLRESASAHAREVRRRRGARRARQTRAFRRGTRRRIVGRHGRHSGVERDIFVGARRRRAYSGGGRARQRYGFLRAQHSAVVRGARRGHDPRRRRSARDAYSDSEAAGERLHARGIFGRKAVAARASAFGADSRTRGEMAGEREERLRGVGVRVVSRDRRGETRVARCGRRVCLDVGQRVGRIRSVRRRKRGRETSLDDALHI